MPARHVIKQYAPGYHYHVYNRGAGGNNIFNDNKDYKYFLKLLKENLENQFDSHLLGSDPGSSRPPTVPDSSTVDLVAYCLMPNHFHFMFKLNEVNGITNLLRRVLTSYSMHFNKKYNRFGSLFQGKPKAALITEEPYFLHLTRYIHQNPLHLASKVDDSEGPTNSRVRPQGSKGQTPSRTQAVTNSILRNYEYSSYKEYLGMRNTSWVKHAEVLKFFRSPRRLSKTDMLSYESFVENPLTDSKEKLGELILEKV